MRESFYNRIDVAGKLSIDKLAPPHIGLNPTEIADWKLARGPEFGQRLAERQHVGGLKFKKCGLRLRYRKRLSG